MQSKNKLQFSDGRSDEILIRWINAYGRWRDIGREDGGWRALVVYFQGALERWKCGTGWGRDVINPAKEQHWAHIKQMISAWVMLSWHYRLWWDWMIMPVAEEEDRLRRSTRDKSAAAYLMHTNVSALHCVPLSRFTLPWLSALSLAVCVYLTCESQPRAVHRICLASSGTALALSEELQRNPPCTFLFISHISLLRQLMSV